MRPRKDEEALVDVLDVLLRDGVILRADVIVSVAEIPLVGIKLTAAIAGMETMNEYGLFEEWDVERRRSAITRRQHRRDRNTDVADDDRPTVGSSQQDRDD
ncbi:gas vesicle protein GvpM [Natronorubrum bangense]|uniref:Gas vesicle protein n=2 Tax=Natronorubrum bangense TaxID=61858 RepID=A0A4D6HIY4_9EURY|nr:gas vesicle protein [Natronorubrum bangense]ELY43550.1 gas vesicle protein GvpA [Natronorubrum bangense JCM 10635]QCC53146.1 gas vesicle protein [Natronorubrum bangense]QCC56162.1 gas vesicle protein [Natronorubrum bangense]